MSGAFDGPIGLIVNPRSQRNRERIDRIRAICRSTDRLIAHEIPDVLAIPGLLREFAQAGVTLVAVSGGDGTIQAAMTALIVDQPFTHRPPLAVLSGGMTNVTGHQVGVTGKPDRGLQALLDRRAAHGLLTFVTQPVMGVRATPEAPPQYGMLLGGAAFHDGTMLARRRVHPVGFAQSSAVGVAGAAYFAKTLLGMTGRGHRMAVVLDGGGGPSGQCYFFLASCLPGLNLGLNPFWGEGSDPLRWTWVDDPPRWLAIAAGPLMVGRPFGWMKRNGYHSGRARRIEIMSETPLLFDGERIEPQAGKPVIIESGQELTFARL